ncbi:MAG: nitrous oxide-stimulated promoter family protein [Treponema sp.]|nr:nitrous oxide-stimulated promoter family protein [Treponema sp.]
MKSKIEREKQTVSLMIRIYCRGSEGNRELCNSCLDLLKYAHLRLSHCPYGNNKPACKRCTSHCYKPAMRDHIREVMRFSGPRMILHGPIEAFRHILKI